MSVLLLLVPALLATPAWAATFPFICITNNDPIDCAIGEAQLSVTVFAPDPGLVGFRFENEGPDDAAIARVYFDDSTNLLTGITAINNGPGVSFSEPATPGNLPGGNEIGFFADYSAGATPPPAHNGVDPGEWLEIIFGLVPNVTVDDVIAAVSDWDLRIGVHVIDFASGGSESFIAVPVPAAALLGLFGFGFAGMKLRRFV